MSLNALDQLEKQLSYATQKWEAFGTRTKKEIAEEIAFTYNGLHASGLRDQAWSLISKYQRVLGHVIHLLKK